MCSRKFEKEWKKKISVRLIVCLNDMMNVASYANPGNGLCFHERKRKEIRTRLVNIHYIYLYGICKAHAYKHIGRYSPEKKTYLSAIHNTLFKKNRVRNNK